MLGAEEAALLSDPQAGPCAQHRAHAHEVGRLDELRQLRVGGSEQHAPQLGAARADRGVVAARKVYELRAHDRGSRRLLPAEEAQKVGRGHLAIQQAEPVRDEPTVGCGAYGGRCADGASVAPRHARVRRLREHGKPCDAA